VRFLNGSFFLSEQENNDYYVDGSDAVYERSFFLSEPENNNYYVNAV
jgi:hypothetical protein